MTSAPTPASLAGPPGHRRWPGLLLLLAVGSSPDLPLAQDWPAGPEAGRKELSQPFVVPPFPGHRGLYWSIELGLASATAGGAGRRYSLETLSGGGPSPTWTFDLRLGQTLRPDLRLGLAFGGLVSRGTGGGFDSTAAVGHVGGELSWHPRYDGPFLRGELGLGWLQLYGSATGPDVAGRDRTCLGPEVTVGGGYLWAFPGSGHLVGSVGLSWARYTDSGGLGGRLGWSLAWTGRIGVDVW